MVGPTQVAGITLVTSVEKTGADLRHDLSLANCVAGSTTGIDFQRLSLWRQASWALKRRGKITS